MDSAIRKGRRAENNLYEAERGYWDVLYQFAWPRWCTPPPAVLTWVPAAGASRKRKGRDRLGKSYIPPDLSRPRRATWDGYLTRGGKWQVPPIPQEPVEQ
jgi:hypothetical protein